MGTLFEIRGAGLGGLGKYPAEGGAAGTRSAEALGRLLGSKVGVFPPSAEERPRLEAELGDGLLRELESLGRETDPGLFSAELFRIAVREEIRSGSGFAFRAYAWLAENGDDGVRAKAAERLAVSEGKGSAGSRAEHLLRGFAKEASDPVTLCAMAAGGGVYRATRLAAMSRLAGGAGVLGRGAGLRLAGGAAGLALEAPTFTVAERLGRGRGLAEPGWGEELLSSYLVLGGLKTMGAAATRASRGLGSPELGRWIGIGGMYGGIMLGHGLETAVGLREWSPGGREWVEGLALLVQFQVSGKLLHQVGGARYRGLERELDLRAERLAEWGSVERARAANDGDYPPIQPAANGPHLGALDVDLQMAVGAEWTALGPEAAPERGLRLLASKDRGDGGDGEAVPIPRSLWGRLGVEGRPPTGEAKAPAPERKMEILIGDVPYVVRADGLAGEPGGVFYTAVVSYLEADPRTGLGRVKFTFLDHSGGPFGGQPIYVPRAKSEPAAFREGEIVKFFPTVMPSSREPMGPQRSGPGWAYFPNFDGKLFRVEATEIPERKGGILPRKFVAHINFWSTGSPVGLVILTVESLSGAEGAGRNLALKVEPSQWRDLGFDWPNAPGDVPIPSRKVLSVEDGETILRGLQRRLEGYAQKDAWSEGEAAALGKLIVQIEDLGKLMQRDTPWLEDFYEKHGDRLILEAEPETRPQPARPQPWHHVFSADGDAISLRIAGAESVLSPLDSGQEVKRGLLLGVGREEQVTLNGRVVQAQNSHYGRYRLRVQYHSDGHYRDIDVEVGRELAGALGFQFSNDKLIFPPTPLAVELKILGKAAETRPWLEVAVSETETVRIQSDWKHQRRVVVLEDGDGHGALVPKIESRSDDKVLLPRVEGHYWFTLLYKDKQGRDRRSDIRLAESQALALGFKKHAGALVIPQDVYLMVKVSHEAAAAEGEP